GKATTDHANEVLTMALDLGVNHIDTSNIYGMGVSEERIGEFLKKNPSAVNFFKIATKGGIERTSSGGNRFNNSREHLTKALDDSLRRLGVDSVELYYVHRREHNKAIEGVTETLSNFVKQGKVRQIGYSEISPNSLIDANEIHPIAAIQSEYSLSTRYPELGLLQRSKSLDTALVAFSPVGRSLLTDQPHSAEKVQSMPFLKENPRFLSPNIEKNIAAAQKFRELASDLGVTAAGLALAWLLNKDTHILPIPGTRSADRLKTMVEGSKLILSSEQLSAIENALPVGWAFGDRYSVNQWIGPEKYS
ncbi:MAG: aldo/keto reductase, partial [Paracoccaceae bacterium]|nr:aldo/keto reductase [Paracoccaceae bacterium]